MSGLRIVRRANVVSGRSGGLRLRCETSARTTGRAGQDRFWWCRGAGRHRAAPMGASDAAATLA
ncbi:hypothetical protein [Salinispora arenicola]|uniref:hypothetical protein n=1 Tax=Salinispora arenicola TaxID=168697 RepID=UPI0003A9EDC6|nr:hypothetical protein [Salinispora arenicola]